MPIRPKRAVEAVVRPPRARCADCAGPCRTRRRGKPGGPCRRRGRALRSDRGAHSRTAHRGVLRRGASARGVAGSSPPAGCRCPTSACRRTGRTQRSRPAVVGRRNARTRLRCGNPGRKVAARFVAPEDEPPTAPGESRSTRHGRRWPTPSGIRGSHDSVAARSDSATRGRIRPRSRRVRRQRVASDEIVRCAACRNGRGVRGRGRACPGRPAEGGGSGRRSRSPAGSPR